MKLSPLLKKAFSRALIFSSPALLNSCKFDLPKHEPVQITGKVIEGKCNPSVLGSGDEYLVTIQNDSITKTLRFIWPEATEMCETLSKKPNMGDEWKIKTVGNYTDPNRSRLDYEYDFEILDVTPAAHN